MKLSDVKASSGTVILATNNPPVSGQMAWINDVHIGSENGEDIIHVIASTDLFNQKYTLLKFDSEGKLLLHRPIAFRERILPRRLYANPFNPEEFIIGTNGGLFVSRPGNEYPIPDLSIPPVRITDLEYDKENNKIIAIQGNGKKGYVQHIDLDGNGRLGTGG